jgi:signal transduction histidine kinase/DNA-binding NarL/FixJ family response regulator
MDTINQIVAQEQSIFIMLAEFAVFTVFISLIIYHLIIYIGRKSFPEGRLYLYFSGLFFGLLFYIFIDTCQFGVLFWNIINVPDWNAFLISVSWIFILKSIMLILQYSLNPSEKKKYILNNVFTGFVVISVMCLAPVFLPLKQNLYLVFLGLWVALGTAIVFLLDIYLPILLRRPGTEKSSKIIGWTSLMYISYIWFYKLITSSSLIHDHLPFWIINNFLKIAIAFTFAYALARRFNKEFTDLVELKENLEKKVEESTRELRLAKERIEEASAQKTNYFINVAHETKTPLTLIGNYLDRYSKRVGPSDELDIVKENFDLLRDAMVLFLDVEKFEKGEIMYDNCNICDLAKVLDLKMPLFKEEALRRSRNFRYDIDRGICIHADHLAIERIVNNLFDNALKFTQEQDEITISLSHDEQQVYLTVSDTGIGIDARSVPHIFDLYYQASVSKSNQLGFGMGLYIVKQTVEAIGGTIEVKSNPGEGTSFLIKFPLTTQTMGATNNTGEQLSFISGSQKGAVHSGEYLIERKNILIVEDNADMLRYISDELAEQYNVFAASNGDVALSLLKTSPKPDLILSDVMMDGIDGFDFYHLISKENTYSTVPFIFITARSNNAEKIEMLTQGVSDYIFKPFSMEELKAKIVSILKNTSRHRKAGLQDAINAIHSQLGSPQKTEHSKWEQFAIRSREYDLTERQIEVIKLVEKGLEYKQIADTLNISPKTIHRHIQILFEKFQVHNKLELLKVFFE